VPGIIDADVHNALPATSALFPYLSAHWREYIAQSHFKGVTDTPYPKAPTSLRPHVRLENGVAGGSIERVREDVLDPLGLEIAILNCVYAVDTIHNPDLEVAMARAINDWQIEHWLEKEPRVRASIVLPIRQPEEAAKEIDRVGAHRGFVQALLPARTAMPYGKRAYHPLFAAIERHDLVAGLAFGGLPGNPPTSSGWPSYYIEEYAGMAQVFQSQLMSIIVEGVFDRFPSLRLTCLESGFTWLPAFLWRFDKDWKGLRREVPWNSYVPSEYVRRHVRLTLQPIDGPDDGARIQRAIDQLGSPEMLLFSTDFPHRHFEHPDEAIPTWLRATHREAILGENARTWYRLAKEGT